MSVELALKSQEYLTADYCFSCAYFANRKGHFGQCAENLTKRPYDGTKFGSSCIGWRKKSDWQEIEFKPQVPPERTKHKLIYAKNISRTAGQLGSVTEYPLPEEKRLADYRHQTYDKRMRFPRQTVQEVINLVKQGLSMRDISKLLAQRGQKVSHGTISLWVKRFANEVKLETHGRGRHRTEQQKAEIREKVKCHRAKSLPNCRCVYHRAKTSDPFRRKNSIPYIEKRRIAAWEVWGKVLQMEAPL